MKKNLLKLLTLVLALVMVVTVFAGCKKADEETVAPTQGSEETPTETQEQPADEYKPSAAQLLNGKEWGKDYTELYDEIGDKVTIDDVQEDPTTGLAYVEYEGKTYELGMDFLSMAMVYKTAVPENSQYETEDDVYAAWWKYYMTRWNYLLPEIPLYSNEYYDVYNAKIKGVDEHPTNPYWGPAKALIDWTSEKADNDIIIGNTTDLSGKFRYSPFGGSNPGAADLDVDNLINGLETVATTKEGGFEVNKTVVKQLDKVENEDGTLTYTITLNDGLLFSDGTPVTAKNYLYFPMVFSTLVASEAEGKDRQAGLTMVGFEEFNAYDGTNEGDGVSKTFTGLRLLADNQFSVTVKPEYANYYYAISYAGFSPFVKELWCGDYDIADDGEGCYLSDAFYAKDDAGEYVTTAHLNESRYDVSTYPFSGAYVITDWDQGTKQCTLTINPEFKGNFEGQTPSIETIVYVFVVSETQLEQLKTGAVDVLSGITGGDDTKAALAIVDDVNFSEVHYQRAGYGKVEFECDFGPTMFPEVRQAITYLLNRTEFCQTFTGGYGVVVDGPYSPDFDMWKAVQDDIELIDYTFSPDTAKKVLEEGGWIYNSKGEPYVEGATGVDAVRYKKLTAEEANAKDIFGNDAGNKTYASVANTDNVVYKTVEINGEYYMPLAINWFGTTPNTVTDLLNTNLANSSDVAAAGMVIRATTGDFTTLLGNIYRDASMGYGGTPIYGMCNLATGWNNAVYDYAYNWSPSVDYAGYSSNKVIDPYDLAFPYDQTADRLTYEEAVEASGDKLGMDYLSMGMVYNATTEDEYNEWWMAYIERWNELMPDIPLYSNYYYDVYNANIENFVTSPFFGPARAILYSNIKGY